WILRLILHDRSLQVNFENCLGRDLAFRGARESCHNHDQYDNGQGQRADPSKDSTDKATHRLPFCYFHFNILRRRTSIDITYKFVIVSNHEPLAPFTSGCPAAGATAVSYSARVKRRRAPRLCNQEKRG